MKMRSLAMLAVSGLMAASFAYIAPAFADDTAADAAAGMSMDQAPAATSIATDAMNNPGGETPTSGSDASSPDQNGSASNGGDQASAPTSGSGSDQGSPDTATGDDDY